MSRHILLLLFLFHVFAYTQDVLIMTNETEMKGQLISRSSNSVRFQHDDSDKPVRVVTALIQHLTLSDGTAVIKDGEILISLNDHKQILTNQQFAHSLFKSGQHLKRFLYLNLAGTVLTISAAAVLLKFQMEIR